MSDVDAVMLTDIEYLPRPCFSLRVSPDTWTVRAGQVEVLRFLSVPFTSPLVATSTVGVEEGNHTLRICLGADDAFSPPSSARTVQPANMSQWVSSGREPVIAASAAFLINPAPGLTKAITRTLGAIAGVSMLVNPVAIMSMQSAVMFSQMTCMKPSVKAIAKEASWTLSPLAAIAPAIPGVHFELNMLLWNFVALALLGLSHYAVVSFAACLNPNGRRWALTMLMYPHVTLTVAMILYQGTTFAAYRSILHKELSYLPVTLPCLGIFSFGMPFASWWWMRTKMKATWTPNRIDITFAPKGIWLPVDQASRYGFFFDEFRGAHKNFKTVVFIYFHAMALVTSLQLTTDIGCNIQLGVCIFATFSMACAYLYLRPLRWTVCNIGRALTLTVQAAQLLSGAVRAADNVEATITLLLMGACAFEGILCAATTIREYFIHTQLMEVAQMEVDIPGITKEDFEMMPKLHDDGDTTTTFNMPVDSTVNMPDNIEMKPKDATEILGDYDFLHRPLVAAASSLSPKMSFQYRPSFRRKALEKFQSDFSKDWDDI